MGAMHLLPQGHDWLHIATADGRRFLLVKDTAALLRAYSSIASVSNAASSAAALRACSAWV